MIVYSYNVGDGEDVPYFETLAEAKKDAQVTADFMQEPVEVLKQTVAKLPARSLAVALLSRWGWCASAEVVLRVVPKQKPKDIQDYLRISSPCQKN